MIEKNNWTCVLLDVSCDSDTFFYGLVQRMNPVVIGNGSSRIDVYLQIDEYSIWYIIEYVCSKSSLVKDYLLLHLSISPLYSYNNFW